MNSQTRTRTLKQHRTAYIAITTLVVALAGGLTLGTAQAAPHGHGGMGMGMMGQPAHLDRMLDSVDASAEQRSQIKAIVETARADMRAQRATGQSLRSQALQLFTQPTVDARSAEALRQQMLGQHDEASKRMMQVMLDVSRVLSPEQRQKLGERMTQQRSRADRPRAPRDTTTQ